MLIVKKDAEYQTLEQFVEYCKAHPGEVKYKNGIVVIRRQDAEEVAAVAQKKKAGEDKTFALMASDLDAYAAKHLASTAKRFEGHLPDFIEDSYTKVYDL